MSTYAYGVMLAPGKESGLRQLASEIHGARHADHDDYLRRYHLVKEYGWLQATPMGQMVVVYLEGTTDFLAENRKFAASTHPFDVWYKQQLSDYLGQDLSQPLPPNFVETLYESHDAPASGRDKPLAIAALVQPGKGDALRRLVADLLGPKIVEFQDNHRRFASAIENLHLEHTPQGDILVYYVETDDPARQLQAFGQSQNPFDLWYKQQLLDITGIDYNQPLPGPLPELVMSTSLAPVGAMR